MRFSRTAGGRPGVPAPRRVKGRPFFQWRGPTVWTTLALTINADGTSDGVLAGASTFPRHWVYDERGALTAKSGLIDFEEWYRGAFGPHSPWGDEDSPALVAMTETALEREMSSSIMRGGKRPTMVKLAEGETLVEQGQPGTEIYLLLDGLLAVDVDGTIVAEVGPGAVVGERALLEGGTAHVDTGGPHRLPPGQGGRRSDRSDRARCARRRPPPGRGLTAGGPGGPFNHRRGRGSWRRSRSRNGPRSPDRRGSASGEPRGCRTMFRSIGPCPACGRTG